MSKPIEVEIECIGTPDKRFDRMYRSFELIKKVTKRKKLWRVKLKQTESN